MTPRQVDQLQVWEAALLLGNAGPDPRPTVTRSVQVALPDREEARVTAANTVDRAATAAAAKARAARRGRHPEGSPDG